MKKLLLLLLSGLSLFAGKSLRLSSQQFTNTSVAARAANAPERLEFQLSFNPTDGTFGHVLSLPFAGINFVYNGGAPYSYLQIYPDRETGWGCCTILDLRNIPDNWVIVRYQQVPSGAGGQITWEVWNENGVLINTVTAVYTGTSGVNSAGVTVGLGSGAGANQLSWGFLRAFSTTVPLGGRPPLFSETGDVFDYKFNGTLNDTSGNFYTLTGTPPLDPCGISIPCYEASTGQDLIAPIAFTVPVAQASPFASQLAYAARSWDTSANHADYLDGSSSYSQTDSAGPVACAWSVFHQPSGSPTVKFGNPASCLTTVDHTTLVDTTAVSAGAGLGDYDIELDLTDQDLNTNTSFFHVGAVNLDANGVIVPIDPNVTNFFGPLIGFGYNPWGFEDYIHAHAMDLRYADYQIADPYNAGTLADPIWDIPQPGVMSWTFDGKGFDQLTAGICTTVLTSPFSSTDTVLHVNDLSCLDVTSLPTRIGVWANSGYPAYLNTEELRICSVSGFDLTICYDGRGYAEAPAGNFYGGVVNQLAAQAWNTGDRVGQFLFKGVGTNFLATLAPGGAGPGGPVRHTATSAASLTAGSATLTNTDTSWDTNGYNEYNSPGTGVMAVGDAIRVPATHSSTAFTFTAYSLTGGAWAAVTTTGGQITAASVAFSQQGQGYTSGQVSVTVTDNTGTGAAISAIVSGGAITGYTVTAPGSGYTNPVVHITPLKITMSRVYPSTADNLTGVTVKIVYAFYRQIVAHFVRPSPYSGDGQTVFEITGCEDGTHCYGSNFGAHDATLLNGTIWTGQGYSYQDTTYRVHNQSSTGGDNFYGEDLASCSLYYRSGLKKALDACDAISRHWIREPSGNTIGTTGSMLYWGGGIIGASASSILRGVPDITDLRPFWDDPLDISGTIYAGHSACESYDARDSGYSGAVTYIGARYDNGAGNLLSNYRTKAQKLYARENLCKTPPWGNPPAILTNSWATPYWNSSGQFMTLASGSSNVTGVDLSAGNCDGIGSGTVQVTNGSNAIVALTGSFASQTTGIVINGHSYAFLAGADSTHGLISVLWPDASSSTATYMTRAIVQDMMAFAQNPTDPTLYNAYACIWNSSTQITLDRGFIKDPAHVTDPDSYQAFQYVLAGIGIQPFMLAIKTWGFNQAAALDPLLGTHFLDLKNQASTWVITYGFDFQGEEIYYGRGFGFCEPPGVNSTAPVFDTKIPGCSNGMSMFGLPPQRELNQEGLNAAVEWFKSNPTSANRDVVDKLYGAFWCKTATGWTDSSVAASCPADGFALGDVGAGWNVSDTAIHGGKYYGQYLGMGMASEWPALRLQNFTPLSRTLKTNRVRIQGGLQ